MEIEEVGRTLLAQRWIFAKTMSENPHEYTLRKHWQDDHDFIATVQYIRQHGYKTHYMGRPYIQLDVNEHFYWTMGSPLAQTILINRKLIQREEPYDSIAPIYDDLFLDVDSKEEDITVLALLGDLSSKSVLDIGCGTGWLLDHARCGTYTGIDPSTAMLNQLHAKHLCYETIATRLQSFVGRRYDVALALFGVGSYLTDVEFERIPLLLNPGGRYVIMSYAPGYIPRTYQKTGIYLPLRENHRTLPSCCIVNLLPCYTILEGRR